MRGKRPLSHERAEECAAARALFFSKKGSLKLSQRKLAEAAGISPSAVNLYFKGLNQLNAKFAAVLARLLDEPVEKFSPRLAQEIEGLLGAVRRDIEFAENQPVFGLQALNQHTSGPTDVTAQHPMDSLTEPSDQLLSKPTERE